MSADYIQEAALRKIKYHRFNPFTLLNTVNYVCSAVRLDSLESAKITSVNSLQGFGNRDKQEG